MENLKFLDDLAASLDFTDSDDRATFRRLVANRLQVTKINAMNEWINKSIRNRNDVIRAVADAYISFSVEAQS